MTRTVFYWDDYIAEDDDHELKQSAVCESCGGFKVQPENVWFDEHGYGYATKLTKCPYCNRIIVLKHIEDVGFSKLNTDARYF